MAIRLPGLWQYLSDDAANLPLSPVLKMLKHLQEYALWQALEELQLIAHFRLLHEEGRYILVSP
ncbi:MAG: hypothetical protein EOP50_20465 [Sphingobacteriales bacterium]|nr:MAG: hypothetical protein EOP50_20465 [Sphingobacteriales bacterium]